MSDSYEEVRHPYMENVAIISPEGMYGLWQIKLERGPIPREMQGTYTSVDQAIKTIEAVESVRRKTTKEK